MDDPTDIASGLLQQAKSGDLSAVGRLFDQHRARLRRIIEIRLDPRLEARIDPSDVLQEAYVDLHNRIHEFMDGDLPFFLWVRLKIGHRLTDLHRFHLRHKRDAGREVSIARATMPAASSVAIASQLLGRLTSVSQAAIREEFLAHVQNVLNTMDEIDREVIVLRHFEDLSNAETAQVLEISQNAASNRYVRALRRLKSAMDVFADYTGTREGSL